MRNTEVLNWWSLRRLVHALNCGCIRVGVMFPTVEVRYKNLLVEAECEVVHGKPLPTLCNYFKRMLSAVPKPVLTLLDLSFPLASSDLGAENLENKFIFSNMHLCQIQRRIEEMAAAGEDTTSLDDEAFNMEAALDRCILRLIASCCNCDKLVRATELVKLLSLEKSVRGTIKLVTALKLPNLAERFNTILEGTS